MKKIKITMIAVLIGLFTIFPQEAIHAEDFASDESGWQNKCSTAQNSSADKAACERFTQYLNGKKNSLDNELSSISEKVKSLQSDISKASDLVKDLATKLDTLNKEIELNEANIRTIESEIGKLETDIIAKQKAIDKRDNLIKKRMQSEQATLGTNMNVEIIMGANDLVDLVRKVDGLQKITSSDQDEITTITKEKKKLSLDKSEQERLKGEAESKKAQNIENRAAVETMKTAQEEAVAVYRKQEAELAEKQRSVQVDIKSLGNKIIQITDPSDLIMNSSGFVNPVPAGYISAGTWAYPGGGTHLGLDKAAAIGSPLYAPADGVILYANNPAPSNGGYLGNWIGYPQGGGNTIQMLTQVNGTTYAISFFHLSQDGFAISAGSSVAQGQLLARTGNSGNSTGPHCHIEVLNLGSMSVSAAISRFRSTADFAWGNGWGDGAVYNSCSYKGAPCRLRPESMFS